MPMTPEEQTEIEKSWKKREEARLKLLEENVKSGKWPKFKDDGPKLGGIW